MKINGILFKLVWAVIVFVTILVALSVSSGITKDRVIRENLSSIVSISADLSAEASVDTTVNTSLCADFRVQAAIDTILEVPGTFDPISEGTVDPIEEQDHYVSRELGVRTLTGCASTESAWVVWAELSGRGKVLCYDSTGVGRVVAPLGRSTLPGITEEVDRGKRKLKVLSCASIGT